MSNISESVTEAEQVVDPIQTMMANMTVEEDAKQAEESEIPAAEVVSDATTETEPQKQATDI